MRPREICVASIAAALCGMLTGLTGCASIGSREVKPDKPLPGMTYYLPMRYAEVAFERFEAAPPNAAKIEESKAMQVNASARLEDAIIALIAAESKLLEIKKEFAAGSPQVADANKRVAEAKADSKLAREALDTAEKAFAFQNVLKQGWKAGHPQCGFEDRFKLTLRQPVADTSKKYAIDLKHYWTRKDDWDLKTSVNGLLSNVDGTITDQSAEILVALAQSAAAVGSPIPDFGSAEIAVASRSQTFDFFPYAGGDLEPIVLDPSPCDFDWKEVELTRVIDPAREDSWTQYLGQVNKLAGVGVNQQKWSAKKQARCFAEVDADARAKCVERVVSPQPITFTYKAVAEEPTSFSNGQENLESTEGHEYSCGSSSSEAKSKCASGLYFRRELPLSLRIEDVGKEAGRFFLMLPNHSGADFLPLPASAFATTTQKVGFTDGILVSLDSERPSELLTVAAVPWKIAAATIGVLSQIIQFRVDYATSEVTLIKQQTEALEAMQARMREQDEYEAELERRAANGRQQATGTNSDEVAEPEDAGQR